MSPRQTNRSSGGAAAKQRELASPPTPGSSLSTAPTSGSFDFSEDPTEFERIDVADMSLADRMPVAQRMHALLGRDGSLTMAAVAGELDVPVDTIVKTAKRGGRFVRILGPDNVCRIGLLARVA